MDRLFQNNQFLKDSKDYEAFAASMKNGKGPVSLCGLTDSAKACLIAGMELTPWKLLVVRDEQRAKQFARDIRSFQENTWFYPAKDFLFYQADTQGTLITRQRVEVLKHLLEDAGGIVVTTIDALMDKVLGKEHFSEEVLTLRPGMVFKLGTLERVLAHLGYERLPQVEAMGQFSIRGGIADIYPFTCENPVRLEFWDDEVDSIRSFDPESQRSIENLEELTVYPASDHGVGGGKAQEVSLLDYFAAGTALFLDEPLRLKERGQVIEDEFRESVKARLEQADAAAAFSAKKGGKSGKAAKRAAADNGQDEPKDSADVSAVSGGSKQIPEVLEESAESAKPKKSEAVETTDILYSVTEIMARLQTPRTACLCGLITELKEFGVKPQAQYVLNCTEVTPYKSSFELLVKDLSAWQEKRWDIVLFAASASRASRLAQELRDYQLKAYCPDADAPEQTENQGGIRVLGGYLHTGFQYPDGKFVLLTESDMFGNAGEVRKKKKQKKYEGRKISRLSELSVGDYVVHESHGIGIYRGIERITTDGVTKDYIKVEYGDGGNLYLPATKLEGIQKYAGADAKKPKLNRLNGGDWQKTRARVQKAVGEIAKDLVLLYAERGKENGFRFGEDTVWQREFEEMFPYEETADQTVAIEATKADMESRKIMDRLICGDVGYGKTEVALRAAFKAVQDSKQVAYLAPTTILAQQIYNTFVERMKGFPVNISLLCRFRTPAQVKHTIEDLKKGRVDVVVGTHRLLSKDIAFKDLGLLIVDEEQRFGVADKEKIKQLKKDVDVLTLTATPIPRTLHMSLAGIRDMSVLEEPPIDRLPIQTYVMEYNDELVREAISRELARGGQVYYVHNRVKNIEETANHVQALCPSAVVAYAHGQMSERELEQIMLRFINGEIDVLVSTTIIETGLDIPNANTMIVADADHMGLSQLYQLRGRVGRSSRTAYAFLMYKRGKMLTEESEKRLKAIREFTQLGSGIRIAMRDLEIRGAGNVLGAEQHGHMEAVGYDLYCKLLNQAVRALKGEEEKTDRFETSVDVDIDAFLPDSYITNEYQKLDTYKRISSIENEEDYLDMQDELTDRFGTPPRAAENLLRIALLKALAHRCYVTDLSLGKGSFTLKLYPEADIRAEKLPELVKKYRGQLRFVGGAAPSLRFEQRGGNGMSVEETMRVCEEVLKEVEK